MSQFVIIMRKRYNSSEEIYGQAPTENLAISRADRLFDKFILDSVAVVEMEKEIVTVPYKRTRKCKHTNIQFLLGTKGEIKPTCEECGIIMVVEEMEEVNEKG